MDIDESVVVEIWNMMIDHIPANQRNAYALKYINIFMDNEVELSELNSIRGDDEHLDYAIEEIETEQYEDIDEEEEE
jgi:hypothetical protein